MKKNKFLGYSVTCVPHRYSDRMDAIKWILSRLAIRIKTLFPLTDILSYVFTLDARLQTWPVAKCYFPILVLFVFLLLVSAQKLCTHSSSEGFLSWDSMHVLSLLSKTRIFVSWEIEQLSLKAECDLKWHYLSK